MAAGLPRTSVARLTATRTYRPCAVAQVAGAPPLPLRCPALHAAPEQSERVADALTRASGSATRDATRVLAMGDIVWSGSKVDRTRRAITTMEKDSASLSRSAAELSDLAAAYVAAAERSGSTLDLLHAVDVADRAVEVDSASAAARWNLAVALDMLTVDGEAIRAWDAYLAIDSVSPWAAERRAPDNAGCRAATARARRHGGAAGCVGGAYATRSPGARVARAPPRVGRRRSERRCFGSGA
jgi:hypothetical protein